MILSSIKRQYFVLSLTIVSFFFFFLFVAYKHSDHIRNIEKTTYIASGLRFRTYELALLASQLSHTSDMKEKAKLSQDLQNSIEVFESIMSVLKQSVTSDNVALFDFDPPFDNQTKGLVMRVEKEWEQDMKPMLLAIDKLPAREAMRASEQYNKKAINYVYNSLDKVVGALERHNVSVMKRFNRIRFYTFIIAILSALAIYFYVKKRVLRPLLLLIDASRKVENRSFDVKVDVQSNDEMGEFCRTFNHMVAALKQQFEDLEQFNRELLALSSATNILIKIESSKGMYNNICETALKLFDLKMLWIGLIQEGSYYVKPMAHAGIGNDYLSRIKVTWDDSLTGRGPVGTAIKTRKPSCMNADDALFAPWRLEAARHGFSSILGVPLLIENRCIGALALYSSIADFFDERKIKQFQLYANTTAAVIENLRLIEYMINTIARVGEANDEYTGGHIRKVGEYCSVIARGLGLDESFVRMIGMQATLHDIGKVNTPIYVLRKPDKLSDEEFEIVKKHPLLGAEMIGEHPALSMAKNIALYHHERWDGSGYPYKLKGEAIPLESRIANLADQYDVLRTGRIYKKAFDHETACKIILEGDGRTMPHHFDPKVLNVFRQTAPLFEKIYQKYVNFSIEKAETTGEVAFEWTAELSVGVEDIDNQHKELILINRKLFDIVNRKESLQHVGMAVDFLREYIIDHFQMEELYMEKYGYPDIEKHKSQHQEFINDFKTYENIYYENIVEPHMVLELKILINNWLVSHVAKTDKDMGKFLKQKIAES
jgi:hemerythrin-like metal-binding protein